MVVWRECCFGTEREVHDRSLAKIMPLFARVLPFERLLSLLR
jgi:hypothetical protein